MTKLGCAGTLLSYFFDVSRLKTADTVVSRPVTDRYRIH